MSHETVRRYWIESGTLRECTETDKQVVFMGVERMVVLASDYDALRTQARELADAVNNTVQDPVDTEWVNMKKRAQAVLDATKEGG